MTEKSERALKMLAKALEMEEKGKNFYDNAVSTCKNDLGREIFSMLGDDELVHIDRIKSIYSSLEGGAAWSDEWKSKKLSQGDLNPFFRELAEKHGKDIMADTDDISALDVGIDFELNSVRFYEENQAVAEDDREREFIEEMIAEEKNHHRLLVDMRLYLTDPASWFREQERGGLDGA
jgi:rubrerythrin